MKKIKISLVFLSILFFSVSVSASTFRTEKKVLPNGLTIIATEMLNSPMTSVFALVKTGSATEYQFLGSGLSHFLEHMLFKGTEKRVSGEIPALIQSVGGKINASTGHDHTIYTVTVPSQSFDVGLDIVSDMIMNAAFDPVELEKEREVVISEMRLYRDNPARKIGELAFENIYLRHPYRHPIIGYESLFKDVKREDFIEYYKMFYTPNNTILSVAGNISIDDVFKKAESVFHDFKRGIDIPRNVAQEPEQITSRYAELSYPTAVTHFSLSYSGINLLDSDLFALDVLSQVLGQGKSSRLYQRLYDKEKLVYSIGASNFTPIDRGAFEIEGTLEYENLEVVIKEIKEEIGKIQEKGISERELKKVKKQVIANHIYYRQTSEDIAYSQAFDEAFAGDYQFSEQYIERVQSLTAEDLKRVAIDYLKELTSTVVVLTPAKLKKEAVKKEGVKESSIEKSVLDNGLTLLLRDDKSFPIVSVQLMANGGVREEPEGLFGVSNIMASTWTKGTKKHTSERIAELTEERAINLNSYSGNNSVGLNMQFLKEDTEFAFKIFTDILLNPIFPKEEIEKVKDNMRKGIERRKDDISSFTNFVFRQKMFEGHSYSRDGLGTLETLNAISQQDVLNLYQNVIVPNNMVLVISGDIDKVKMRNQVEDIFKNRNRKELQFKEQTLSPIKASIKEKVELKKDQSMVMIGFRAGAIESPDRYGLTVLSAILGSPFNGRLFTKIREEEGAAYTVGGGLMPGIDTGRVAFYALTHREKVSEVEMWMLDEMKRLCQEDVSEKELDDTKSYLKGRFLESIQKGSDLAFQSGLDELYGLGYEHYKDYEKLIDSITPADIKDLAQKYFTFDQMVTVLTNAALEDSDEN